MISLGRKHNAHKDTKVSFWETSGRWKSGAKWARQVFLEPRVSKVLVVQLNSLGCLPQVGIQEPLEVFGRIFDFKKWSFSTDCYQGHTKELHTRDRKGREHTQWSLCLSQVNLSLFFKLSKPFEISAYELRYGGEHAPAETMKQASEHWHDILKVSHSGVLD